MTIRFSLPKAEHLETAALVEEWEHGNLLARLWDKDPTVWADPPIDETANRLGWLDVAAESRALIGTIESLRAEARAAEITDIVLCGMGGSSLAPEVFAASLPEDDQSARLTILDSTHPLAVLRVAEATNPISA